MVKMVGAKPIYCDCAPGSVNPSLAELREKATPCTKAVIVCHTYGAVVGNKETQRNLEENDSALCTVYIMQ